MPKEVADALKRSGYWKDTIVPRPWFPVVEPSQRHS